LACFAARYASQKVETHYIGAATHPGLIAEGHARSRADIREQMSGNICRCGAYTNIADAIEDVLHQGLAREAAE
jgi:aerobic-type carbon monoxide dehydrogenase small subunit (CoxS/CutS family)